MLKVIFKALILILLIQTTGVARDINIDKLVQKAKFSNKHLFLFLHKTNCGYCENMIEFTLDDNTVKELIKKRFLFIQININENDVVTYKQFQGNGKDFAKHVKYNFYPTSLFFDDDNDISYAVPGYQDEKTFDAILNYIDSKSYQKINFRKYKAKFDSKKKL